MRYLNAAGSTATAGKRSENPNDQRHATRAVVVVGFYRFMVCRQYRYEPDKDHRSVVKFKAEFPSHPTATIDETIRPSDRKN
jgi:hypothetical protein